MKLIWGIFFVIFSVSLSANSSTLADTVAKIKPSVVGIGVYTPTGRPKNTLTGSGFVVGKGQYVVTNHHVVPAELDKKLLQEMAVFVGSGQSATIRKASVVGSSQRHDLAILKIEGKPLKGVELAGSEFAREGSYVGFTGFPIGSVLGLYPVTHRGIIASITPTITPVANAKQLDVRMLKKLREPFLVYQLDATAYPGNSGSALYDVDSGRVIGVINKVFVQESKEAVISNPSGITYAIPVKYLHELITELGIAI
ncbi:S1C family serine protease [Thalassotalea fusca]